MCLVTVGEIVRGDVCGKWIELQMNNCLLSDYSQNAADEIVVIGFW